MNEIISIIVPVYNSEKCLKDTILSITSQTYKMLDIIFVNDGSTDNSEQIILDFAAKDERIRYYKIENHGVSYARNIGIEKSIGKYICFVDSDDIVSKFFCEFLYRGIKQNNAELSICDYKLINNRTYIFPNEQYKYNNLLEDKYLIPFSKYKGFLANKMYLKRIIVENSLLLDGKIHMCEDLLFNINYLRYVNKVIFISNSLYGYVIENNSSRKLNDKWYSILISYQQIRKNFSSEFSDKEQALFNYNYLINLFEAKVRLKIQKKTWSSINANLDLEYIDKIMENWSALLKSSYLSLKQKIKLVVFYKFYFLSYIIKKRKLLRWQ